MITDTKNMIKDGLNLLEDKNYENAVHIFTHVEWHMQGVYCKCASQSDQFVWVTPQEIIHEKPLPVAFRVYKDWILKHYQ